MPHKRQWDIIVRVLVISFISITALAASVLLSELPVGNGVIIGDLPRTTRIASGQIIMLGEDAPLQNYTIKMKTTANNSNLLPEGQVSLTLTSFSSSREAAEEQAQLWYIHDNEIMTPIDAGLETVKVWYNP